MTDPVPDPDDMPFDDPGNERDESEDESVVPPEYKSRGTEEDDSPS